MDKRISYYIGVDTETCNGLKDGEKLDLTQSLVYDIGWAIVDKRGNIYLERSFVVSEIFCTFGINMGLLRRKLSSLLYTKPIKDTLRNVILI